MIATRKKMDKGEKRKMNKTAKKVHPPGVEPGPPAWQARIIPLDYGC
jgi:hypothetical protein